MNSIEAKTILAQIGSMNFMAISGGRARLVDGVLVLPSGKGYTVEIELTASDDYTVRRVFNRAGRRFIKGEVERVYCDQIGEVAYVASCFVNRDFGGVEVGA